MVLGREVKTEGRANIKDGGKVQRKVSKKGQQDTKGTANDTISAQKGSANNEDEKEVMQAEIREGEREREKGQGRSKEFVRREHA